MPAPPDIPPGRPRPWPAGETAIYHITNVANLERIAADGRLECDKSCSRMDPAPVSIAYADLKERRSKTRVSVGPGGMLSEYVPFYFAPRSPMLFVISRGGVPGYSEGQDAVVHLVSSVEAMTLAGDFVITDGHAATPLSSQFDSLDGLNEVDWSMMNEWYWSDTDEDGDRKRRRQAEFLLHERAPFSAVKQVGA